MKEQITLWKEFKEDQELRQEAFRKDPERIALWEGYHWRLGHLIKYQELLMGQKWGIRETSFENFMDWLSEGKPKFTGVKIEHKPNA